MSTFRGIDGEVHIGGVISTGSPQTKGAVAEGATSATLDGGGAAMQGVVVPGDKFTVAGDATEYTVVTGGAVGASVANEVAITFTPSVQLVGGWLDNSSVTFVNNQAVQARGWSADIVREMLEDSVLGDEGKTYEPEQVNWTGEITALFDYANQEQKDLFDAIVGSSPSELGVTLVTDLNKQTVFGQIRPNSVSDRSNKGELAIATFGFQGQGLPAINWN